MRYILAPSILSADFSRLGDEIKECAAAGAGYIHIDVMDGAFVPNISFGAPVMKCVRGCTDAVFDVHMMVEEPIRFIDDFRKAGADIITVHQEACTHLDRTIEAIRETGARAGVSINPATPVESLREIISSVDMVLIMSVNPGFGGQRYIGYATDKIKRLRHMADELNPGLDIEVDGGITHDNVSLIKAAGANVFVAGSAVFKGDKKDNIRKFMELIS